MLNFYKSVNSRFRTVLTYLLFTAGTVFSYGASATCGWSGAGTVYGINMPIVFEAAGYKLLANNKWYEDSRFPEGSLMGVSTVMLKSLNCASLFELKGKIIDVVYSPPSGSTESGTGYRIPTSAPGVAIDIEFPNGVRRGSDIFLGKSANPVTNGGVLTITGPTGSQVPAIAVKLSIVKTGKFTDKDDSAIKVDGGLGTFSYYSSGDPGLVSMSTDRLELPTQYSSATPGDYLGNALVPTCQVAKLGDVSLVVGAPVITLPSVNTSDFSGIGAIEKGSTAHKFSFTCKGSTATKPVVTFSGNFAYGTGVEGVGMPAPNSDIGIQVLLDGNPVVFNKPSIVLDWAVTTLDGTVEDIFYGVLGPQGSYCKAKCGDDINGANWVNGGAGTGGNKGVEPSITFKYYQTTPKAPVPKKFSVPLTITLDVQ